MTRMTIEEAQSKLKSIIEALHPGESVRIIIDDEPVATLVREAPVERKPRTPGNCKGMIASITDDDDHLADFSEYMP